MKQQTSVIQIPQLSRALTQVWHLLFDLSQAQPDSWCLVGGLMVMLHGLEHGRSDLRPTADGDQNLRRKAFNIASSAEPTMATACGRPRS